MLNKRILVLMFLLLFLPLVGCLTPSNQAPILTSDPVTIATVGTKYVYDVNATDPDGDTLVYSLSAKPTNMTINSATGLINWTPVTAQIGDNSVTVKVSDGTLSITQNFTIEVSTLPPVNQKPVITSTPVTTATVGVTYVYDVNATDPNGDTLTYFLTTKPSGMAINPTNGLIWWAPTTKGAYAVVVKVSDGSLSDTQGFTIVVSKPTVPPTNQAPIIISTQVTVAIVGVTYIYDVEAFDLDGDVLTYSLTTKPSGMVISPSTGKITWTPGSTGSYGVTVKVFDGVLDDTQSFTIVVSGLPAVNHAPVITPIPGLTAILGLTFTYDVEATDPDNDVLTYSLTVKPVGMAIGSTTGVISWIPNATGSYNVTVKVSDGELNDTQPFTITVVTVEITGIEVEPDAMDLFVGVSETIGSVTATYEVKKGFEANIDLGDCTYNSGAPGVATVSNVGVVTGVAEGGATITVTYAGKSDTIVVAVSIHSSPVHNIDTDKYYTTIQSAIDDTLTLAGHTIEVAAGMYNETINITIDDLTIQSLSGDPSDTIIDGADAKNVVTITDCSGVTLSGFKITSTNKDSSGIFMVGASDCSISNVVFGVKWLGVQMKGSSGNSFTSITFSDIEGIQPGAFRLQDSSMNTFESTTISNLVGTMQPIGILIFDGLGNSFVDTEISDLTSTGKYSPYGICLAAGSHENTFTSTKISRITGKTVSIGIYLRDVASHNSFESTEISDITTTDPEGMASGIKLKAEANSNSFSGGSISGAKYGVYVEGDCPSNSIHNTNIAGNTEYGAYSEEAILDATNNWWGSEKGPTHNGWPVDGGDIVSDNVNYENWSENPH